MRTHIPYPDSMEYMSAPLLRPQIACPLEQSRHIPHCFRAAKMEDNRPSFATHFLSYF